VLINSLPQRFIATEWNYQAVYASIAIEILRGLFDQAMFTPSKLLRRSLKRLGAIAFLILVFH
jgi:hypothetical protein